MGQFALHVIGSIVASFLVGIGFHVFNTWLGKRRLNEIAEVMRFRYEIDVSEPEHDDRQYASALYDFYTAERFVNRAADAAEVFRLLLNLFSWGLSLGFMAWLAFSIYDKDWSNSWIAWLFCAAQILTSIAILAFTVLTKILLNRLPGEPKQMRKIAYDGISAQKSAGKVFVPGFGYQDRDDE